MNPENLLQVRPGEDVENRGKFIEENALDVKNPDV
jgi:hypothetical protein